MKGNYQVGDKVVCTRDFYAIGQHVKGKVLTVIDTNLEEMYTIDEANLTVQVQFANAYPETFLAEPIDDDEVVVDDLPTQELGVYRPDINTRKVGKVGMHMFIDGFPSAMYEVAKVMTWAAEHKGYALHDWKNLPEAELALSSAGYRHMVDNSIQKAEGLNPLARVDHESKLLHLAHQAFNILAQIELIKTGKIT